MSGSHALLGAAPSESTNPISGSVRKQMPTPLVPPTLIGRYALFGQIGAGGMGVVHLARLLGSAGFERAVAIKRVHPMLARDQQFIAMFREELRLLARVRHQNVISALDVVEADQELLLVMEYVHGESLASLLQSAREAGEAIPPKMAVAIACGVLKGLHAAHGANDAAGVPLGIIHRDVSPHNVLVGCDGVARVVDFGVAKSALSRQLTRVGELRGKPGYVAPEQLLGEKLSLRADLYALSVVLWEMLACQRLFAGKTLSQTIDDVLAGRIRSLESALKQPFSPSLEAVVRRGLSTNPAARFASARDMALALEAEVEPVSPEEVGEWVARVGRASLAERARQLTWVETCPIGDAEPPAATAGPDPSEPEQEDKTLARPLDGLQVMTREFPVEALLLAPRSPAALTPLQPAVTRSLARRFGVIAAGVLASLLGVGVVSRAGWFDGQPPARPAALLEAPVAAPSPLPLEQRPRAPALQDSPAIAVTALRLESPAARAPAPKTNAVMQARLPVSAVSNPYNHKTAASAPAAKRVATTIPKSLSQDGF